MNINKRNRVELKSFFVKNAIPTEEEFANLIDAMVNQKEDGLVKLPGNPLCIEASGEGESQKKAINFYNNFSDENPDWVLSLHPRSDPADAGTSKVGLSISDATGNSRLFIDKSTGNVGIGTVTPMQTLDINGRIHLKNGVIQKGGPAITNTSNLGLYSQEPGQGVRIVSNAAPIQFFTDSGKGTTSRLSIESSGNVSIPGTLEVTGGASITGALTVGSLNITSSTFITQENWRSLSLKNNWKNASPNLYFSRASYFKDSLGIVHLRGFVTRNKFDPDVTMFTLPSGYRSKYYLHVTVVTSSNTLPGWLKIYPEGRVQLRGGSADWVSLDGVSFRLI